MATNSTCPTMGTCEYGNTHIRIIAQREAEDRCGGCGSDVALLKPTEQETADAKVLEEYLNNPAMPREVTFTDKVAWADYEGFGLFAHREDIDDDPTDWIRWFLFTDTAGTRHWYAVDVNDGDVLDMDYMSDNDFCHYVADGGRPL